VARGRGRSRQGKQPPEKRRTAREAREIFFAPD
jgi:hypothetical protein